MYILTCNVSKAIVTGLINPPNVSWTTEEGPINTTSGSGITISTTIGDPYSLSVLTFDPLKTSHGDVYICGGALDSPALTVQQTTSMEERVSVQSK